MFRLLHWELEHLIKGVLQGGTQDVIMTEQRAVESGVLLVPPPIPERIGLLRVTCLFSAGSSLQAGGSTGRQVVPQIASLGCAASDLQ